MFTDVGEVKKEKTENSLDTDLESEMDNKYNRIISGKSKEELIVLRNYLSGEGSSETSDEEDKPKQKVLKRQY